MLFLIVAVLLFLLQNLSFKEFSRRFPNTLAETARMSRIALPLGALCLIPAGGAALLSPVGFAVSAAFSVCYVLTNALYLASLACGPFSLSAMLSSMGLLVTVVMNLLLWHESLTALRVAGVLCMVVVIVMTGLGRREGRLSLKWFLLSLGAMVTNGLCGVTQKAYQMLDASPNPSAFNFWSFLFAGAIYLAISLARRAQPLPAASKKALCPVHPVRGRDHRSGQPVHAQEPGLHPVGRGLSGHAGLAGGAHRAVLADPVQGKAHAEDARQPADEHRGYRAAEPVEDAFRSEIARSSRPETRARFSEKRRKFLLQCVQAVAIRVKRVYDIYIMHFLCVGG